MISVVSPVWNEDPRNLRLLSQRLRAVLDVLDPSWEVIFIDDGSGEITRQALQDIVASDHHMHVIWLKQRCGQETALVTGLLAAAGTLICMMDCDLEHRPEDIPQLLMPLRHGYDLVLGKRRPSAGFSRVRQAVSQVYTTMMNVRWLSLIHI